MYIQFIKSLFCFVAFLFASVVTSHAQYLHTEKHIEVSMRMIGHQLLLQADDSTSRVLPVQREGNSYRIDFATDIGINPDNMAATIDSVIRETQISQAYIVEVKSCDANEVVYSYEIGGIANPDVVPCGTRILPVNCYLLFITLTDNPEMAGINVGLFAEPTDPEKSDIALFLLPLMLAIGLFIYWVKTKRRGARPEKLIAIGEYLFDPKAMTLTFQSERIELTGKESELLLLLCSSANSTVDRELILEKVWGDQGDYVGRTLDVFISKLRKKLDGDTHVQIKNIRGVGYKLVLSAAI